MTESCQFPALPFQHTDGTIFQIDLYPIGKYWNYPKIRVLLMLFLEVSTQLWVDYNNGINKCGIKK